LSGEYSVSSETIKPVYLEIKELIKKFESCEISWIKRDFNMYADYLTAIALDTFRKNKKEIINKDVCLKQLKDFVLNLKPIEFKKTGFKDIDLFNPKFIRIERENENENVMFDFENNDYYARDKIKFENLKFEDYLKRVESEHGILSYHISLRSADNKRALLVFESDEVGGEEVIKKLCGLIREKGIKFILKDSGNRSLHLVIPILSNEK